MYDSIIRQSLVEAEYSARQRRANRQCNPEKRSAALAVAEAKLKAAYARIARDRNQGIAY
jgi:hypothetical protein